MREVDRSGSKNHKKEVRPLAATTTSSGGGAQENHSGQGITLPPSFKGHERMHEIEFKVYEINHHPTLSSE